MRKTILITAVSLVFVFTSCNDTRNNSKDVNEDLEIVDSREAEFIEKVDTEINDEHNSRNSLDWAGTYEGILPCADCPGISTTLIINDDETYKVEQKFLDRDGVVSSEGKFKWDNDGSVIHIKTEEDTKFLFKIEENRIRMLNQEGEIIRGSFEDEYILEKK